MKRPAPYVPLSVTFATGKTGTAILERFGIEGIGVWAMMLAAARDGLVVFRHDNDWGAIGAELNPPSFALNDFLTFLGRRKQTRKTRQGRNIYVELTRWSEWNLTREREVARRRKSRNRKESERDTSVTPRGTGAGHSPGHKRDLEVEVEEEENRNRNPSVDLATSRGSGDGGGVESKEPDEEPFASEPEPPALNGRTADEYGPQPLAPLSALKRHE